MECLLELFPLKFMIHDIILIDLLQYGSLERLHYITNGCKYGRIRIHGITHPNNALLRPHKKVSTLAQTQPQGCG